MEILDKIAPEQFIHGINECSMPMTQNTDSFSTIDTDARVGLLYEPPITYTLSKVGIYGQKPSDYAVKPMVCIRTDHNGAPSSIVLKQGEIRLHSGAGGSHQVDLGPIVLLAGHKYWLVARAISLTIIREAEDGQSMTVMVEQPDGKWAPLMNDGGASIQPILRFYGRVLPIG